MAFVLNSRIVDASVADVPEATGEQEYSLGFSFQSRQIGWYCSH